MKWALFAVLGLIAVAAIVAAIGATLPRTHLASRTLTLRPTPDAIWPVLIQVTGASSVPVDIIENTPPHRLVTRVAQTEKMFGGTWTVVVAPASNGSTVTITEDGWVGNPIFRFISRLVIGHHATMDGMLKDVAKHFNEEAVLSGE